MSCATRDWTSRMVSVDHTGFSSDSGLTATNLMGTEELCAIIRVRWEKI